MNTLSGTLLGIIQGLTEFLPISSSGHLVIFQNLLGFKEPELLLDCSLHFGTLLAVFIYFREDLRRMITESWDFASQVLRGTTGLGRISQFPHASLTLWVIIGSIPTALIGLFFRSTLESLFGSITIVGFTMLFTGTILIVTRFITSDYGKRSRLLLPIALLVGFVQGLALIPGISRSGSTIVCGILCGLKREMAARFSFLLSIPAIVGALALQLISGGIGKIGMGPLLFGFIASTIVGLIALKILMGMVRKGNLYYFTPYCWALGLVILILV